MYRSSRSMHMLYRAVTIAMMASFTLLSSVSAQPTQALTEDWRATDFNFNSSMMATDVNDNVYVLGGTPATNVLNIKKYNTTGALLWETTYDPLDALAGAWIAADSNGDVVVGASIIRASDGQAHGWLTLKYDTNGNLLWTSSLPGMFSGVIRVAVDASNNIYVAGFSFNDSMLIKYSPSGTILWSKAFDNNGAVDKPSSMVISPDNNRIGLAGVSGNLFMALMYDADGNLLWSNTNPTILAATDLAFGPGNIVYVATGSYLPLDPNSNQMSIVNLDAAGNLSWQKSYSVGYYTYRIGVDTQGNVLATGVTSDGYMDWMTIKTDANGNLLWSQRYDGGRNNDETPNMLAIDAAGAVYVTGIGGPHPSSGNLSYQKGVAVKYNSDGAPQWAVWDNYAGGKALRLGARNTIATLGWGYMVTAHYTETGLPDLVPSAPANLSGYASWSTGSRYDVILSFTDTATNEFWVEAERCTGSGCTDFAKVAQSRGEDAAGLTDTTASRGVTYTYRVRALGFMGLSSPSNTVEIVIPPLSLPAAPSNLTAAMSGTSVVLNWQDNSTNETLFVIERCQGVGCTNFAWLDARSTNITTLTDASVVAGQSYSYRVRASNWDGYSAYSNIATIVVSGGPSLPAAPSNLTATALSRSQINLAWTNNATNQTGVKIERCLGTSCTNFTQIAVVAGTATTYANTGLAANTTYRYRVRAYNSAGNSPYSNVTSARTARR